MPDGKKWLASMEEYQAFAAPFYEAARRFRGQPGMKSVEGAGTTLQQTPIAQPARLGCVRRRRSLSDSPDRESAGSLSKPPG